MKFKFKKAIACIAAFAAIVLSVGSIGFASASAEADERQEVLPARHAGRRKNLEGTSGKEQGIPGIATVVR